MPGLRVEVMPVATSTNTVLLERYKSACAGAALDRAGDDVGRAGTVGLQPTLLIAEVQSAGRGRLGRTWQSEAGASLTFSVGVPLGRSDWSGLSLAVGAALCEALEQATDRPPGSATAERRRLGIKWPNDLWIVESGTGGRKLGGILIESIAAGAQRWMIIGVGVNIRAFGVTDARSGFASLDELVEGASAPSALAMLMQPLLEAIATFEGHGFAAFAQRFAQRDVLLGQPLSVEIGSTAVEGIAAGIASDGSLLLRTPSGVVRVSSGEVDLRVSPGKPVRVGSAMC